MLCIFEKLTHYVETKKMAHDSQLVRAKEDLKLKHGGPSQSQTLNLDQYIHNQKISEYGQEIPQSHTSDQPTTP